MSRDLLPRHGGYKKLRSFQIARLVYDGTVLFCERFVERRSRTRDQMVQAARSGVQNIAEGSLASGTSKETEIKLTNVARASLGELLLDYEDFLRQRGLRQWTKDSPEALAIRRAYLTSAGSERSNPFHLKEASAEVAANTLLCLTHQASALLRKQIQRLEQDFLAQGGLRERMTAARRTARDAERPPTCPLCGRSMRRRRATARATAFWGCSAFPDCRGIRDASD